MGALASDEPLAQRILHVRTRPSPDRATVQVASAVLAGLLGDARDAEAMLMRARGEGGGGAGLLIEIASAFVFVETGNPARAPFHLARARDALVSCDDSSGEPILLLLQAQSLLAERGPAAAVGVAEEAARLVPPGDLHAALRAYASIVRAALALQAGDLDAAERALSLEETTRSGILAARADVLRARLRFARTSDGRSAAVHLDKAIDRLTVIGALRDLALANVERALQAGADPEGSPGRWLARAQAQFRTIGGPTDLEALRRARKTLEEAVPALPVRAPGDGHGIDHARIPRLAAAASELASLEEYDAVAAAIPRLALAVCDGKGAQLVRERPDRTIETVSTSGAAIFWSGAPLSERIREGVSAHGPRTGEGRIAAVPVGGDERGRLALVLERDPSAPPIAERDVEQLTVLASLANVSLARASSRAALREASAREAAMLGAVGDGVLVTDPGGMVRALNHAAATSLGVKPDEAVGRRLRELPGLSPLGFALARRSNAAEAVTLPHGEVIVRPHGYDGGVVSIVRDLATEHTAAKRAVGSTPRFTFERLLGKDPAFAEILTVARRAAAADLPVLITGESGTGKELLAQAIHNASVRASAPFVAVNVTAIPRDLVESELFGYEGGSFTGAKATGMAGKFELAGRGTILLDEIGDMPLELQGKLLRVLQEKVVQRLGSVKDVQVRARVIATTHRDLEDSVAQGRFRLDLFHRLRVVHLKIPSLRQRKDDILLIAEHQLRIMGERTRRRPIKLAPAVAAAFQAYDWPGNIRELCNVIESEASLLPPDQDVISQIPQSIVQMPARPAVHGGAYADKVLSLEELERRACGDALQYFEGNVTRAAQALGVSKTTLYAKMKRYGLNDGLRTPAKVDTVR
ncbi:MAG: sigma 54-interacting transcriptional regulator [Myxococcales bacterium]